MEMHPEQAYAHSTRNAAAAYSDAIEEPGAYLAMLVFAVVARNAFRVTLKKPVQVAYYGKEWALLLRGPETVKSPWSASVHIKLFRWNCCILLVAVTNECQRLLSLEK
jgi:hypothetical protein